LCEFEKENDLTLQHILSFSFKFAYGADACILNVIIPILPKAGASVPQGSLVAKNKSSL